MGHCNYIAANTVTVNSEPSILALACGPGQVGKLGNNDTLNITLRAHKTVVGQLEKGEYH